jgi:hypothetical protein
VLKLYIALGDNVIGIETDEPTPDVRAIVNRWFNAVTSSDTQERLDALTERALKATEHLAETVQAHQ